MNPVFAAAGFETPRRMVVIYTTFGLHSASLWTETAGTDYESTEYLDLLQEHRDDFTLFCGLQREGQVGRQPHNCEMTWLTSTRVPGLGGFRNTISVNQYAAEKLGYVNRSPSIMCGSNLSNANAHGPRNLPIFLAGGGYVQGRYVARDQEDNAPLCNMFVTMLNDMGMESESFGQSTGRLA